MAHYAFLDENNIVTEVIVGKDENEILDGLTPEEWYGQFRGQTCVKTSYNGTIRKNFAGIGYTYDSVLDAFIPPQPFPSWVLDKTTCTWQAPTDYPNDGAAYIWNEDITSWEALA